MTEVTALNDGVNLSISSLALEFGCSRETIRAVIDRHHIAASGTRGTHNVYRLRDFVRSWMQTEIDPAKLPPQQKRSYYLAAMDEVRYLEQCGELVSKVEMEEETKRMVKIMVHALDTLPDILERDCALTSAMVAAVVNHCDKARDALAAEMASEPPEESAEAAR